MGPNAEITDPHTTGDHWQHVFLLCNKHVTVTKTDGWSVDLLLLPPQQSHTCFHRTPEDQLEAANNKWLLFLHKNTRDFGSQLKKKMCTENSNDCRCEKEKKEDADEENIDELGEVEKSKMCQH